MTSMPTKFAIATLCCVATGAWATEFGTVLSSTPVVASVPVAQQQCYDEPVMYQRPSSGAGALIGAIAGAAIGNTVGHGAGRAAVTGIGMVTGAAIGGADAAFAQAPASISGSALWRERITLPAGAVFAATLEDASRADAPADVLGRLRKEAPAVPPIAFAIEYDPARIQPGRTYVVRARIERDGVLLFTTDTVQRVLGPDGRTQVDLLLKRVGTASRPAGPPASAAGASAPRVAATGPAAEPTRRLRGAYVYMADAGLFTDCRSGRRLPVAQAGANAALEAAYARTRKEPGSEVLAVLDGRVEEREPMEGPKRPMLVVERVVSMQLGGCAAEGHASLENTYWKLVRLREAAVEPVGRQREPHLILQPANARLKGSSGCNRLRGGYMLEGERLKIGRAASTMMACPQGMAQERAFLDALAAVERWRIDGERLELLDAGGTVLLQFESVYLR